ncbi:hypothetical protein HWV62_27235 [Athelia sp. TMB]|nr:hypothetical protein HWV62_27235 [Athelia sp. TMB]
MKGDSLVLVVEKATSHLPTGSDTPDHVSTSSPTNPLLPVPPPSSSECPSSLNQPDQPVSQPSPPPSWTRNCASWASEPPSPAARACAQLTRARSMLAYDAHTGLLLLYDAGHALLVDAALCAGWAHERMGAAQVLGYLERAAVSAPFPSPLSPAPWPRSDRVQPELQIPDLPAHAPAPVVDAGLVLRALLVRPAVGAGEVKLWNEVLAELDGAA